jgi:hypothetical protein
MENKNLDMFRTVAELLRAATHEFLTVGKFVLSHFTHSFSYVKILLFKSDFF